MTTKLDPPEQVADGSRQRSSRPNRELAREVKEMDVASDPDLLAEEKELCLVAPNDVDYCRISTEIPIFIKWLQSIDESSFERVRLDDGGSLVSCVATIPKGVVKLQGSARKSNQHSQMVSYGELRD